MAAARGRGGGNLEHPAAPRREKTRETAPAKSRPAGSRAGFEPARAYSGKPAFRPEHPATRPRGYGRGSACSNRRVGGRKVKWAQPEGVRAKHATRRVSNGRSPRGSGRNMQHGGRRTAAQAKAHPRIRLSPALPEVTTGSARSSRGRQSPVETNSTRISREKAQKRSAPTHGYRGR